jgi:hypothetical protein
VQLGLSYVQSRDAVAFPARLLQYANNGVLEDEMAPFSELAKMVGKLKEQYNDAI